MGASRVLAVLVVVFGLSTAEAPDASGHQNPCSQVYHLRAELDPLGIIDPAPSDVEVKGWAVDFTGPQGTGVREVRVYLYDQRANMIHSGQAQYGLPRPDAAEALGDPRYLDSGFSFTVNLGRQLEGGYQLKVDIYSTEFGEDPDSRYSGFWGGPAPPPPPPLPPPEAPPDPCMYAVNYPACVASGGYAGPGGPSPWGASAPWPGFWPGRRYAGWPGYWPPQPYPGWAPIYGPGGPRQAFPFGWSAGMPPVPPATGLSDGSPAATGPGSARFSEPPPVPPVAAATTTQPWTYGAGVISIIPAYKCQPSFPR